MNQLLALLEDDPILGRALVLTLESADFKVVWCRSLKDFKAQENLEQFKALIFDRSLPDGDSLSLMKELKQNDLKTPVLFLTARDHEDEVVKGLALGAKDYIKKPFSNKELIARIKNIVGEYSVTESILKIGSLQVFKDKRLVLDGNKEVSLNRRQFDILVHLGAKPGIVVTREQLILSIKKDGEMFDRTIDSHVSHLRNALKLAAVDSISISSVYGIGYKLEVLMKEKK